MHSFDHLKFVYRSRLLVLQAIDAWAHIGDLITIAVEGRGSGSAPYSNVLFASDSGCNTSAGGPLSGVGYGYAYGNASAAPEGSFPLQDVNADDGRVVFDLGIAQDIGDKNI